MSTYKRRIVYLSDEEWAQLGRTARERKITISAAVRGMLEPNVRLAGFTAKTAQAGRDEILRKIRGK